MVNNNQKESRGTRGIYTNMPYFLFISLTPKTKLMSQNELFAEYKQR